MQYLPLEQAVCEIANIIYIIIDLYNIRDDKL